MPNKSLLDINIDGETIDLSDQLDNLRKFIKHILSILADLVSVFSELFKGLANMKDLLIILIPALMIAYVGIEILKSLETRNKSG